MDIDTPLRELGPIEIGPLRDAVLAQDEAAWNEQQLRQNEYEVHRSTQSIVLVFTDGSGWPNIEVTKQPGWDRLAAAAVPVMHELIGRAYPPGGTIIRAMAARLRAGAIIKPHKDAPKTAPALAQLARTADDRQMLQLGSIVLNEIAFLYYLAPGVPQDRVRALQQAFAKTMSDGNFLADMQKAKLPVEPSAANEVQKMIADFLNMPESLKERLRPVMVPK